MILRRLASRPEEPLSHDPGIAKRVLLAAGEVPALTQLARARIPAGEATTAHAHRDMWEVFLVDSGRGTARVGEREVVLEPGTCLVVVPGERHTLAARDEELVLTYFGLAPGSPMASA